MFSAAPTSGKYDDVPESIREAFVGRPYLSVRETAKALAIDIKTLRRHTAVGNLQCLYIGHGLKRSRCVYTLASVAEFLKLVTGKPKVVRVPPVAPRTIYETRFRSKGRDRAGRNTQRDSEI